MNDDQSLEEQLRALRLAPLPGELLGRLQEPRRVILWPWVFVPLAAAALWLVFAQPVPPTLPQPSDFRVYLPVAQQSTLLEEQDLGLVLPNQANPVRLVSRIWLDELTYAADDGSANLQRSHTRAEIIPVAAEIF